MRASRSRASLRLVTILLSLPWVTLVCLSKAVVSFAVACSISLLFFAVACSISLRFFAVACSVSLRLSLLAWVMSSRVSLLAWVAGLGDEFAGLEAVAVLEPDGGDQQRGERGEHHPESGAEDR